MDPYLKLCCVLVLLIAAPTQSGRPSSQLAEELDTEKGPHPGPLLNDTCRIAAEREDENHQLTWSLLGKERQQAFELIGYTSVIWDNYGRVAADQTDWNELSNEQRQALENIGYNKMIWECDVQGETLFPDRLPPVEGMLKLKEEQVEGGQSLALESGDKNVVIGILPYTTSAIIGTIMGQLLVFMYGLAVEFKTVRSDAHARSLLESRHIDLIMDLNSEAAKLLQSKTVYDYGPPTERPDVFTLYINTPKNATLPYYNALMDIVPAYTALESEVVQHWLPKAPCSMGPWSSNTGGYGVWCLNQSEQVPLIWALGPRHPEEGPDYLMAFLHDKELPFGIEYLDSNELHRRVLLASKAGAPAVFFLLEYSQAAHSAESSTRRLMLPDERDCGDLGTWTHVGKWRCTPPRQSWHKLAGTKIDTDENVRHAVETFFLSDEHMEEIFSKYRRSYAETKDVWMAITASAENFISSERSAWRSWFTFPEPMSTHGQALLLSLVGASLLAFLVAELWRERPVFPPDTLDRRTGPNIGMELFAGMQSTLGAMMDAVGIAAVVLSTPRLHPYSITFLMHVAFGQFVIQSIVCFGSNYETPICTSSIELLPFLAILVVQIEASTKGRSGECVIATLLVASALICTLSGLIMYTIGKLKLGSMLRYLPYTVKTGVMAGMGIVLLAVALELCSDENFLEFERSEDAINFFRPPICFLWLPALLAAVLLFCVDHFVVESPYTIISFLVLSISGFHLLRVYAFKVSMADAADAGWLYGPAEADGDFFSLYRVLRPENICWSALVEGLPTIVLGAFVAPILNNVGDLAVVRSVLPPAVMGDSDFNEELVIQGRAHVISGLCCGFSSDYGNDDAIVHRMFGGKRRLSMYTHCITLLICLFCPWITQLLTYIPKLTNGGPIALAGIEFLYEALVESRAEMRNSEYIIVVIFVGLVLVTGGAIETAILVGTFLGFTDFIIQYSNVGNARVSSSKSATTWTPKQVFRLEFCGLRDTIVAVELQGFLFFASGGEVVKFLLERLSEAKEKSLPHRKVLIVDWTQVPGLDTGAAVEFERLQDEISKAGVVTIFCGFQPAVLAVFERCGFKFIHAVGETTERLSLRRYSQAAEGLSLRRRSLPKDSQESDDNEEREDAEEDSGDEEPSILLLRDLDQALHRAEIMQLRGVPIEMMAACPTESLETFDAKRKFRFLAIALKGKTSLCGVLRRLTMSAGRARLVAFHDGAPVLKPGVKIEYLCILLAGCVVAYTEEKPVVMRHGNIGQIFGEEALTHQPFSQMGHRAAQSCLLLQVKPETLEPDEQIIVLRAIAEQVIPIKNLIAL